MATTALPRAAAGPHAEARADAHSRWLVLTQYYHPEVGAPQLRLRCMVRELRDHGIDVEVLTAMPNYPTGKIFPAYRGKFRSKEHIDGVPVRRIWLYAGTGRSPVTRLLNYLSFTLLAVLPALSGRRPDVLFVESQPLSLGMIPILLKWLRGVPYIYNIPDLQVDGAKQLGFISNPAFLKLAEALEHFFMRYAWKVSTVTERFIDHFQRKGMPSGRLTFLPNGADTDFLKPMPPSQELLDRWQLHGKKVFLYVGTHAYYHGLDTLMHAAKQLQNRRDIVFLMIGDGPVREPIKALARDLALTNVIFDDSPYEERDKLYSITYASLASLRNMELANKMRLAKIFPSLSCAVPVVHVGFGEGADLIRDNGAGVVVPPENADELAAALVALSADRERRDAMGAAGRRLVEAEYSWKIIVTRWLAELGSPGAAQHDRASAS